MDTRIFANRPKYMLILLLWRPKFNWHYLCILNWPVGRHNKIEATEWATHKINTNWTGISGDNWNRHKITFHFPQHLSHWFPHWLLYYYSPGTATRFCSPFIQSVIHYIPHFPLKARNSVWEFAEGKKGKETERRQGNGADKFCNYFLICDFTVN